MVIACSDRACSPVSFGPGRALRHPLPLPPPYRLGCLSKCKFPWRWRPPTDRASEKRSRSRPPPSVIAGPRPPCERAPRGLQCGNSSTRAPKSTCAKAASSETHAAIFMKSSSRNESKNYFTEGERESLASACVEK